jgi:Lon protease-like protein
MSGSSGPLMLFPLELVLLPGELLPLHIFEERYRRMVRYARETGEPFGVVLRHQDGVAAVGCTARLSQVVEELPDGRFNIIVRGERPFRLTELVLPEDPETEPLAGAVEYLEDESWSLEPRSVEEARALRARIDELADDDDPGFAAASPGPSDDEPLPTTGPGAQGPFAAPSYRLAGGLDLEITFRQRLLQLRGEKDRLELLTSYMQTVLARLEILSARKDAIKGNGKGY